MHLDNLTAYTKHTPKWQQTKMPQTLVWWRCDRLEWRALGGRSLAGKLRQEFL